VLSGLLRDAVLLAGRGTATPADIDTAMRLGAGHPTGPFEVLAGLTSDQRGVLGVPAQLPGSTASGTDTGSVGDDAARETAVRPAPARELARFPLLTVVVGALGIGLFFGATLTSLTGVLAAGGNGERADLLYGVMGIGSAALALGSAALPARFSLRARWIVFGGLLLAGTLLYASAGSVTVLVVALAVLGCGVGPTLVSQYSLAAQLSPAGRSTTTMTMLGSAVVVGQATASASPGSQ
jgi:hypothetical protein